MCYPPCLPQPMFCFLWDTPYKHTQTHTCLLGEAEMREREREIFQAMPASKGGEKNLLLRRRSRCCLNFSHSTVLCAKKKREKFHISHSHLQKKTGKKEKEKKQKWKIDTRGRFRRAHVKKTFFFLFLKKMKSCDRAEEKNILPPTPEFDMPCLIRSDSSLCIQCVQKIILMQF